MNSLTDIIEQVAAGIRCDASGSCVVFATELARQLEDGIQIIEGAVRFAGSALFPHVWAQAGENRIDPTLEQFDFFDLDTVEYIPGRGYSPSDFLVAIENHPQRHRFEDLKKL